MQFRYQEKQKKSSRFSVGVGKSPKTRLQVTFCLPHQNCQILLCWAVLVSILVLLHGLSLLLLLLSGPLMSSLVLVTLFSRKQIAFSLCLAMTKCSWIFFFLLTPVIQDNLRPSPPLNFPPLGRHWPRIRSPTLQLTSTDGSYVTPVAWRETFALAGGSGKGVWKIEFSQLGAPFFIK